MAPVRILVVDDEPDILESMKQYLEACDHAVQTVADPARALEMLGDQPFDIVISDINMPGMTGVELLRRMKAENPLLQVIMITAYSSMEKIQDCLQLGACDYLVKPIADMEELNHIIGEAARRIRRWRKNFVSTLKSGPAF